MSYTKCENTLNVRVDRSNDSALLDAAKVISEIISKEHSAVVCNIQYDNTFRQKDKMTSLRNVVGPYFQIIHVSSIRHTAFSVRRSFCPLFGN